LSAGVLLPDGGRCYAVPNFHKHSRFDTVQVFGSGEDWFARLLAVFSLLDSDGNELALVFARQYDAVSHSSPQLGAHWVQASKEFHVFGIGAVKRRVSVRRDFDDVFNNNRVFIVMEQP
jgi:hypothetical protein